MSFFIVNETCNGCLACVQNCPAGALNFYDQENTRKILHNISVCARCGHCWRICPQNAIEFKHLLTGQWDEVTSLSLVHCSVCGEPIYTSSFKDSVSGKLSAGIEALCPDHKGSEPVNVWKKLSPKRTAQ